MRSPKRIILTILIAVMMLSFLTGNAQATDFGDDSDSLSVSIQSASYLDLDKDMIEDDILTVFTISVPEGALKSSWTLIYMLLEMPSGRAFGCNLLVIGFYSRLSLTLGWYNTANEAGWYTFSIAVYMIGNNVPKPGFDSLVFDPPTEGEPGPPLIQLIRVVSS